SRCRRRATCPASGPDPGRTCAPICAAAIRSIPGRKIRPMRRRRHGRNRVVHEGMLESMTGNGMAGSGRAAATLEGDDLVSSRLLRLRTIVRLRWLAVGGQTIAVIITVFWLQFPLPLTACSLLIAFLAWVNAYLTIRYPPTHRLQPPAAFALLGIDLAQLAALLFITGGLANPFAPL